MDNKEIKQENEEVQKFNSRALVLAAVILAVALVFVLMFKDNTDSNIPSNGESHISGELNNPEYEKIDENYVDNNNAEGLGPDTNLGYAQDFNNAYFVEVGSSTEHNPVDTDSEQTTEGVTEEITTDIEEPTGNTDIGPGNNDNIIPDDGKVYKIKVNDLQSRAWIVPYIFSSDGRVIDSTRKVVDIENLLDPNGNIVYGDKLLTPDNIIVDNKNYVPYVEKHDVVEMQYDESGMEIGLVVTETADVDNSNATEVVYASPKISRDEIVIDILGGDGWGIQYLETEDDEFVTLKLIGGTEDKFTVELVNSNGINASYMHPGPGYMALNKAEVIKALSATIYVEHYKNGEFISSTAHTNVLIPIGG